VGELLMMTIDITAIVDALQWWHLLWVFAAAFVWSLANVIAKSVVSFIFRI
jgi:hypothetical protein